ncbi:MAG: FAD-dependent oxidoreductase [Clostridia bacterium]|nr:FAD-dependent oxidoreductase [Clostridia bacterium]
MRQTSLMYTEPPPQPNNPTDRIRHELTLYALAQNGRTEDFEYILKELSPPPQITQLAAPGQFKGVKVGVIGGGLAGLSAAFELRKLGFDITIFEALEDRIGGRVYTQYFNEDKTLYGEFGPMRIPVSHETAWHYINLFKLNTRPFIQVNRNAFIYLQGIRVRNDPEGYNVMKYIYPTLDLNPWERNTPWQQLVYYGLNSALLTASPQVRSEILQVKPMYDPQTLYWDATNIRQLLESLKLSEAAIKLISDLAPLAGAHLYNSYIDYVQENYPVDLSFLYEIIGGFVNLPLAFYYSLLNPAPKEYHGISPQQLGSVTWRGGCNVTGIYKQEKVGAVTLAYTNRNTSSQLYEPFDYVVCTIPFSTLRTVDIHPLFSNRKMQAIKEVTYVPAQKSLFLFKQRFWEMGGPCEQIIGGGSYTDRPITTVWYPSDHQKYIVPTKKNYPNFYQPSPYCNQGYANPVIAQDPGVLVASYNFNLDAIRLGNMEEEMRFEEINRELEEVHGLPSGYLNSITLAAKTVQWNREPWFRGAFCFFTPEQKRLFSCVMAAPEYNCKVFFAGEHISATHRWMQGALKSGMEAANALAMACQKHTHP